MCRPLYADKGGLKNSLKIYWKEQNQEIIVKTQNQLGIALKLIISVKNYIHLHWYNNYRKMQA